MGDKNAKEHEVRYSLEADQRIRAGRGRDFGADLFDLYRAGRHYFPLKATRFVEFTTAAHEVGPRLREQTALCGGPPVLERLADLRDLLQEELRRTAMSLRVVGPILVQIATDYAETDQDAAAEFNRLAYPDPDGTHIPAADLGLVRTPPEPPRTGDPVPGSPTPHPSGRGPGSVRPA